MKYYNKKLFELSSAFSENIVVKFILSVMTETRVRSTKILNE